MSRWGLACLLLLPAAGWGEKEGTFVNSERRIGLVKQVSRAPGQALSDFRIFQLVAEAWGCGELFADLAYFDAISALFDCVSASLRPFEGDLAEDDGEEGRFIYKCNMPAAS